MLAAGDDAGGPAPPTSQGPAAPAPPRGPRSAREAGTKAVSRCELARTFFLIGLISYGGPAIVARIRDVIVTQKGWLSDDDFQESLAFCQTLPGPVAVQTAAHVGWRLHRGPGALVALTSYVIPAFLLMLALSAAYFRYGEVPLVAGVFRGLGAVVVAIVADSILSMAKLALRDARGVAISAAAAAGFFLRWNTVLVLLGSALAALVLRARPRDLPPEGEEGAGGGGGGAAASRWGTPLRAGTLAAVFLALVLLSGRIAPSFPILGATMMKIDLLAFGGGYTAVALMYEQVVAHHGWLGPKEFVDGLALGQITPGPVIITATFIGYKIGGVVGAIFATFCVFWPSALLLVVLAPQFARIRRSRIVGSMVRGLLAAFVAMLFFVLWNVAETSLRDAPAVAIAAGALLVLRFKVNPSWVILAAVVFSAFFLR